MTHPLDRLSRRSFLGQSALVGGALAAGVHSSLSAAEESDSSLEKLNIACVGTFNRAASDIKGVASENIVALCDVDQDMLDKAGAEYTGARKYRDFRVMLEEEEKGIDAVVVGTPDHTHAPAAAMAMRMKKHVYCEKPLAHTVYETRVLADLAKEHNLVTQMGTQVHAGDNYRRVVELVQSGTIGEIREVHVFHGVNYTGRRLITGMPTPSQLDWDLWLGPTPQRPYCESVTSNGERIPLHPFHWRHFWDYSAGGMGDFGCHYMDLPHWALKLMYPTRVSATGPTPHLIAATAGIVATYEHPARGDMPPVTLTWYDGGRKPEIVTTLKGANGEPLNYGTGSLFVGSEGMIIADYSRHALLPADKFSDADRPEPFIPASIGHHKEWTHAIKNGGPTTCNFEYSGALTESVLLGVASYRSGEALEWDAENLRVTNSDHAQQFIHKEYRKGWTL